MRFSILLLHRSTHFVTCQGPLWVKTIGDLHLQAQEWYSSDEHEGKEDPFPLLRGIMYPGHCDPSNIFRFDEDAIFNVATTDWTMEDYENGRIHWTLQDFEFGKVLEGLLPTIVSTRVLTIVGNRTKDGRCPNSLTDGDNHF